MSTRNVTLSLMAGSMVGLCALAGCQSGRTVSQDKTVRTRSDGTRVVSEDKVVKQGDGTTVRTETRKVDRPND